MGIISVLFGLILVIEFTVWVSKKIKQIHLRLKLTQSAKKYLKNLDPAEQSALREFYIQQQNTITLPMDHPVVAGLLASGILRIVGKHGKHSLVGVLASMKISDRLQKVITRKMVGLPIGELSKQDIKFFLENRPPFTYYIQREEKLYNW